MGYFLFILFFSFIFSLSKDKKRNINATFVVILILILLNGLRGLEVGRDTINYYMMYTNSTVSDRIEPLFRSLIVVSKSLGLSYNAFLIIVASLIYLPLFGFIKKWSVNPSMSLVIYMTFSVFFMQNSFNVLRNAIAASFLLWCIGYISNKQYKKAILPCIIASGFHYSILITIPFIVLSYFSKHIKQSIAILLILGSVAFGLSTSFYENLFSIALQQISLFSGSAIDNYSSFLSEISETELNNNGLIMLIAPFSLISILTFMSNKMNDFWRMVLFYGVILGNLFVSVLYTYRLTTFLTLTTILIIPELLKQDSKFIRFSTSAIVLAMSLYYIYTLSTGAANNIIPYKFYD